jgi:tetratricopeptide (TPR) repeat protein
MSDQLGVKAWEEIVTFPTYSPPAPDLNPMFLEKRVNQGTSGRVYPNPFLDQLSSTSELQEYQAVYLENAYIRLMMLPQIGGRIHEAYDKAGGYHFIYRQHVIKPALIGLFGSWVSGGIEYNWPQHHRPSTFMPTHHLIEEHPDGSTTVWFSEHDPLQRMKGMVGVCLHPDKAFFEMKVQLYNRTAEAQTFLWWINVGVHVHEEYEVVFPPDVTTVTDHSKRSMSLYPVARGSYYGIDYSNKGEGTDLSRYGSIPVPTSYFVWDTEYDYFGGYDHRADAGIVHVANRHIAPGKKMFTWGAGEFAKGWEDNLTDADGPYIELMAGVYTDNQPDFSWMQPYETKTFSQFWYPVQKIGPAKTANRRAAVNLEVVDGVIKAGVAVTETLEGLTVSLTAGDRSLLESTQDIIPGNPLVIRTALPPGVVESDLLLRVIDAAGDEVIRYAPQVIEAPELPEAMTPPPPPETFDSTEELYLTGLHLEQYRHPTIDPEPYWEAALAKDPTDARCNNAMGLNRYRRGQFEAAVSYFQAAIDKLTQRNPNPRDGEPFYDLGMTLKIQGEMDGAYAALYKAIWSYGWQAPGYYALAEIDSHRGDFVRALDHLNRSLQTNALNMKARNLKSAVLRHLGRLGEAAQVICETVALDPLDMMSRNEAVWISRAQGKDAAAASQLGELTGLMAVDTNQSVEARLSKVQAYLDMAFDYANAALWTEARDLLERLNGLQAGSVYPMVLYALGAFAGEMGDEDAARDAYRRATELPTDYCFPVRLEEMRILEQVQAVQPGDAKVAYYLGNLYYDKKRYEAAISQWRRATQLAPDFATPWRNLGIAAYNVQHDSEGALAAYEKAFALNPLDGRVLSELDQLRRRTGVSPEDRLSVLEEHMDLVRDRDDLSVEIATLYNQTSQPRKALDYVLSRRFHPWEGGTGRVSQQYVQAHLLLGRAALGTGDPQTALEHFETTHAPYPATLGERRMLLWPDADVQYYTGLARQALGDEAGATANFENVLHARAGWGASETAYYQALALRALGREAEAEAKLHEMLEGARAGLEEQAKQGFATSVPEFVFAEADMETRRRTHLTYIIGLAHQGLGETGKAREAFEAVLAQEPGHAEALVRLRELK